MPQAYEGNIEQLYHHYASFDLVVDSRRVHRPSQTLFFALPGNRTHGAAFVADLARRGVRHFVIPTDQVAEIERDLGERVDAPDLRLITLPHPLTLLQALAAHHRRQFTIPVVAITGSNGKTIVKDWLVDLLAEQHVVCATPRSYNSQIGVALSVWQLRDDHTAAVFEAGISERGEMESLAAMIQPTLGVFTMLGTAHAAGFADEAEKLREKFKLFTGCQAVVLPAEQTAGLALLGEADVRAIPFQTREQNRLTVLGETLSLDLPELPPVYRANAYTATATARVLDVPPSLIQEVAANFTVRANRLELRAGLHGFPVVDDSYSNDFRALAHAVEFTAGHAERGKITLVLGRLQGKNFGELDARERLDVAAQLATIFAGKVNRLLTVGGSLKWLGKGETTDTFPGIRVDHYPDAEALLRRLPEVEFPPQPILVKGGHTQRLRRVADRLSRRRHRTVLRIDLNAVDHNLRLYRSLTGAKLMVMVKAAAYGGGLLPIARTLQENGADYLAVAYPDEGRELRRAGIHLPILVLNADPAELADLEEDALEPTLHSAEGLRAAIQLARSTPPGPGVHLEIDTGMARLGFDPERIQEEFAPLKDGNGTLPKLRVKSIFTHLTSSEDEGQDAATRRQIEVFDRAYATLAELLGYRPARHVLNTNGVARFPAYAYEMVRLGIGLYGIGDAENAGRLVPALRLTTRIAKIRDFPAGTPIGYGGATVLDRPTRVGTLDVGYADGLPRAAGRGRFALTHPTGKASILGQVCMDMTMVDLNEIPAVREGDELEIFGPNAPISDLAGAAGTIPYEILTGVGGRVWRVYVRE